MKTIRAVAPYAYSGGDNFKNYAFRAWQKAGGAVAPVHYPPRFLHHFAFRHELPRLLPLKKQEARLRFVQPYSLGFDTWPDHARYEIVPMIWDCWPKEFERTCHWLAKHHVRTVIVTASQTAERIRWRFPNLHVLFLPEGIDTSLYGAGRSLADRRINLLEIGSVVRSWYKKRYPTDYERLCLMPEDSDLSSNDGFRRVLQDVKVTVMFPRCMTQTEEAGDVETLTQRYWEAMLSRVVMVGHAPSELVELVGYNPVIELNGERPTEQIKDILHRINDYQTLVDRNRQAALAMGDWSKRMKRLKQFLLECGYQL